MRAPIWRGRIEKGAFKLDNRDGFKKLMESFEGKRIELVLRERVAGRSDQANRYYWGICVKMLAEHIGYSDEEMHRVLKERFKVASTAKLNSQDFQDYINKVVRFAATDFSINIPDPDGVEF